MRGAPTGPARRLAGTAFYAGAATLSHQTVEMGRGDVVYYINTAVRTARDDRARFDKTDCVTHFRGEELS